MPGLHSPLGFPTALFWCTRCPTLACHRPGTVPTLLLHSWRFACARKPQVFGYFIAYDVKSSMIHSWSQRFCLSSCAMEDYQPFEHRQASSVTVDNKQTSCVAKNVHNRRAPVELWVDKAGSLLASAMNFDPIGTRGSQISLT